MNCKASLMVYNARFTQPYRVNMRNQSLQISRGIAALLVVFQHLFFGPYLYTYKNSILQHTSLNHVGDFSVYFFFALSGYVLTLSINNKDVLPIDFLKERFARIYPEYIFWVVVAFMFYKASNGGFLDLNFVPKNMGEWVSTLILFPPIIGGESFSMMLGNTWSLVYEIYFYTIFSFLIYFVKNKKHITITLCILFFFSYYIGNSNFDINRGGWVSWPYIITDFHCMAFAIGSAIFYTKDIEFKNKTFPAISIIFLLGAVFFPKNLTTSTLTWL